MPGTAPQSFQNIFMRTPLIYSPNSLLTRRKTLSFSGSYGWSLLGISRTAGKASVKLSTLFRIRSAIYNVFRRLFSPKTLAKRELVTYMLVYKQNTNILSFLREAVKCLFNSGSFGFGVHDDKVSLGIWRVGYMLRVGSATGLLIGVAVGSSRASDSYSDARE